MRGQHGEGELELEGELDGHALDAATERLDDLDGLGAEGGVAEGVPEQADCGAQDLGIVVGAEAECPLEGAERPLVPELDERAGEGEVDRRLHGAVRGFGQRPAQAALGEAGVSLHEG